MLIVMASAAQEIAMTQTLQYILILQKQLALMARITIATEMLMVPILTAEALQAALAEAGQTLAAE